MHIIEVENLPVTVEYELAGSWGDLDHKTLTVEVGLESAKVWFKIKEKGKLLCQVPELSEAVRIYNNL